LIAFGRTASDLDFPYLDIDGEKGVFEAVEHLIGLGHRRIGFIAPSMYLMFAAHRLTGYKRALRSHGLEFDPTLTIEGNLTQSGGSQSMRRLLDLENPPTAVVAGNDLMAFGAMEAAQERGLVVGRDIAVIGFDDVPLAAHFHPSLTTVRQPIYEIGQMLSQRLVRIIEGKKLAQHQLLLEPELVIRESSGLADWSREGG
jgi:DNA-binding LacI/PurR family transcriptional regulator